MSEERLTELEAELEQVKAERDQYAQAAQELTRDRQNLSDLADYLRSHIQQLQQQ